MSITIIHENCDVVAANDKQLPNTAYLVTYKKEDKVLYDIAMSSKQADIFDHYYDKYKKDFVTMKQAEGQIRPNLWNDRRKEVEPPKKKRKRKTDA
tara:strand:+ start:468 stop:755 length:288 start_codon:yes stop_codon:yes gene_type:complete